MPPQLPASPLRPSRCRTLQRVWADGKRQSKRRGGSATDGCEEASRSRSADRLRNVPGQCDLDPQRQPVPVGVPGELYIGGAGVALGATWKDSKLTASRFVPDPFVAKPDARMFQTGDRVRWRSDGVLEIIGRFDRQVKLSGCRVEPGEIETVYPWSCVSA